MQSPQALVHSPTQYLDRFKFCYLACPIFVHNNNLSINIYCFQRLMCEVESYCVADNNLAMALYMGGKFRWEDKSGY